MPLPTLLTFVVATLVMCLDLKGTFHEASLNHLIITMCRPSVTGDSTYGVAWWRFLVAQCLDKCARVFTISYVSAGIFLVGIPAAAPKSSGRLRGISTSRAPAATQPPRKSLPGTSDGTVNLVLNCTALSFLCQVDNMMIEPFAMLTRKSFGLADKNDFVEGIPNYAQLKEMCKLIHREPRTQRNFVTATWFSFMATWLGMCVAIFAIQRKTSNGDMAEYGDHGALGGLRVPNDLNVISFTVRYVLLGLMVVYTLSDCAVVGTVLRARRADESLAAPPRFSPAAAPRLASSPHRAPRIPRARAGRMAGRSKPARSCTAPPSSSSSSRSGSPTPSSSTTSSKARL